MDEFLPLPSSLRARGFTREVVSSYTYLRPPLCAVPPGSFLMGTAPNRASPLEVAETPQHQVTLPTFHLGRYCVTVAEYACFVDGGYAEPRRWQHQLGKLDHPVVYVSWHDALAYAAWLAQLTDELWRLPSEAEWEKAAGWDPAAGQARVYPWGDTFDRTRCNSWNGGRHRTSSVGAYADRGNVSPCGAYDLAGNVWEWTASCYQPYPYMATDGREDQTAGGSRVMRGGGWRGSPHDVQVAHRFPGRPDLVHGTIGFRVVLG